MTARRGRRRCGGGRYGGGCRRGGAAGGSVGGCGRHLRSGLSILRLARYGAVARRRGRRWGGEARGAAGGGLVKLRRGLRRGSRGRLGVGDGAGGGVRRRVPRTRRGLGIEVPRVAWSVVRRVRRLLVRTGHGDNHGLDLGGVRSSSRRPPRPYHDILFAGIRIMRTEMGCLRKPSWSAFGRRRSV